MQMKDHITRVCVCVYIYIYLYYIYIYIYIYTLIIFLPKGADTQRAKRREKSDVKCPLLLLCRIA